MNKNLFIHYKGKLINVNRTKFLNYYFVEYWFSKSEYDFNFSFKMAP